LEAVFDIVGHVADLLDPGLDNLVLVSLLMRCHHESEHHLELMLDESLITLDAQLQSHLLRDGGLGVAERSIQHGLANALGSVNSVIDRLS